MRMAHGELSLSFYQGQDNTFFHNNASSESSTVATGWLFFSIALGSLFTFIFFAALSTSFYCCEKTKRKDPNQSSQSFFNEGNSERKLFFPNVPSTVYPTTHSILQQEQNEVVESLSPAYRELPSTHLTYPSSYDTTVSVDQTFQCDRNESSTQHQLTTFPNSTQSSCNYRTTSLSSAARDPSRSAVTSIPDHTCGHLRSQSAPGLRNDSSLSIRVASTQNPEACLTSSTSGILSGDDLMTRTFEETTRFSKNTSRLAEPALPGIISGQRVRKDGQNNSSRQLWNKMRKEQMSSDGDKNCYCCATKPSACLCSAERRCRSSGWELTKGGKPHDQTRSYSEGRFPKSRECHLGIKKSAEGITSVRSDKPVVKTFVDSAGSCEDKITCNTNNFKKHAMTDNSSQGASSFAFGDDRLISSNSSGTSLSNYYALTFRREASILSDGSESNSSLRGASAFAFRCSEARSEKLPSPNSARRGIAAEPNEGRGASSFGMKFNLTRSQQGIPCPERNEATPGQRGVEINSPRTHSLTGNSTRPNSQKYNSLSKPVINVEYEPQTIVNNLNNTYQSHGSVQGASEFGDQDGFNGKCYDNDTLCESISISFAYESPSEDEMVSHFMLKEN